jgi:hypothetical protein
MGEISIESIECVYSAKDFKREADQLDPVKLWAAIKSIHRSESNTPNQTSKQNEALIAYQSVRHRPYKSTYSFTYNF